MLVSVKLHETLCELETRRGLEWTYQHGRIILPLHVDAGYRDNTRQTTDIMQYAIRD